MKFNAIVDDPNAKMRYWRVNLCEDKDHVVSAAGRVVAVLQSND